MSDSCENLLFVRCQYGESHCLSFFLSLSPSKILWKVKLNCLKRVKTRGIKAFSSVFLPSALQTVWLGSRKASPALFILINWLWRRTFGEKFTSGETFIKWTFVVAQQILVHFVSLLCPRKSSATAKGEWTSRWRGRWITKFYSL